MDENLININDNRNNQIFYFQKINIGGLSNVEKSSLIFSQSKQKKIILLQYYIKQKKKKKANQESLEIKKKEV